MSKAAGVTLCEFWHSAAAREAVRNGERPLLQPASPDDYPARREMWQRDHGREPASGGYEWSSIWLVNRYIIEWQPVYWRKVTGYEFVDWFFVREFSSAEVALQIFANMSKAHDDEFEVRMGKPLKFRGGMEVEVAALCEDWRVRAAIDNLYCELRPGEGTMGTVMCRAREDREDVWLVMTEAGVKAYLTKELRRRQ